MLTLLLWALLVCTWAKNTLSERDPKTYANAARFASQLSDSSGSRSSTVSVEVLTDKITHYHFDVRVGSGTYDVVRVHRVVKVSRGIAVRMRHAVFLDHGP